MPNPKLTTRMKHHFQRQIALSHTMLAALTELQNVLEEERVEEFAQRQQKHSKETVTLRRERDLLMRDWNAAKDLDDEERAEVRALEVESEELTREIVAQNDLAMEAIRARMQTMKANSAKMRRSLQTMCMFRQAFPSQPGFIDKKT